VAAARRLRDGPRRQVPPRVRHPRSPSAATGVERVVRRHRLDDVPHLRLQVEPQRHDPAVRPLARRLPDRRLRGPRGELHQPPSPVRRALLPQRRHARAAPGDEAGRVGRFRADPACGAPPSPVRRPRPAQATLVQRAGRR
jgi:hypothetical protein